MLSPEKTFYGNDNKFIRTIGITVLYGTINENFPIHNHDFYETFIVTSGSAVHVQGAQRYPVSRGDVFSIRGDMVHGFQSVQNLSLINLEYIPGFFQRPHSELRAIPGFDPLFLIEPQLRQESEIRPALKLDDSSLIYLEAMANFILELQERGDEKLYPVLRMNFEALVSYLATQYDAYEGASSHVAMLSQALAYMEKHISDPIVVKDVASHVFLSPRQLERLFLKYCDETPMRYLKHMRMTNALEMLSHQKCSIADAARKNGFDDLSYFTRVFRTTFGITPSAAQKYIYQCEVPVSPI